MVARWGMSRAIGPQDLRQSDEHPFLGREIAQPRHFSEATAHLVDEAVGKLLREAELCAEKLIKEKRAQITKLIEALNSRETLDRAEILELLDRNPSQQSQDDMAAAV